MSAVFVAALAVVATADVAEPALEWQPAETQAAGALSLDGPRPDPGLAVSARDLPNTAGAPRPESGPSSVSNRRWWSGDAALATAASDDWVDPDSSGRAWEADVDGLLTFRGNPTRSYHGRGPVPSDPAVDWSYPNERMCSVSTVAGEEREWCGTGWTGQPAVFERGGRTWVVFGAYDGRLHFLDADTGKRLLPPFETGDLVKGAVTVDPDGYPLLYVGSRDDAYRVIAFDGDRPRELWRLEATDTAPIRWNNDWDGAGLVLDDFLFVGGENSRLHIARLNRGYDEEGRVTVAPELVFDAAGWDDTLLGKLGDHNVSIENSVAVSGDTVFFANSGGLVQGWNIGELAEGGEPQRVFRFWTGDDTDATVTVDRDGMLYAASEWERFTERAAEVGQVVKLDPGRPDDPLVWSWHDPDAAPGEEAGVWASPALHRDVVIVATDAGTVYALDREDGTQRWSLDLTGPTWQSPVIVDDVLVQGDCSGKLRGFDVSDTETAPEPLWQVRLDGCIESTPAVWDGRIYVGTRGGFFHAMGDAAD